MYIFIRLSVVGRAARSLMGYCMGVTGSPSFTSYTVFFRRIRRHHRLACVYAHYYAIAIAIDIA